VNAQLREGWPSKFSAHFLFWAGTTLAFTGLVKVASALGDALVLRALDPLFGVTFRALFLGVGLLESVIALLCLFCRRRVIQLLLVNWVAMMFLIYRIGLAWVGFHGTCHCLGNFTSAMHISQQTADFASKGVLAFLLIGSCTAMYCDRGAFSQQ
jgi:hypothetical protein